MKVALGLKAHSGWAALVAVGKPGSKYELVHRCRVELVENQWAKQPYHAAEDLSAGDAQRLVRLGIQAARRIAVREIRATIKRLRAAGHEIVAGAVLMGDPMPAWTVAEILAVHFRMHKAEGVLFRDALARAVEACSLTFVGVPEKKLDEQAEQALATSVNNLRRMITSLGKSVGPPWARDQKDASLAAIIALQDTGGPGHKNSA